MFFQLCWNYLIILCMSRQDISYCKVLSSDRAGYPQGTGCRAAAGWGAQACSVGRKGRKCLAKWFTPLSIGKGSRKERQEICMGRNDRTDSWSVGMCRCSFSRAVTVCSLCAGRSNWRWIELESEATRDPEGYGTGRQALRKEVYNLLLQYQKNKTGNKIWFTWLQVIEWKIFPKCKTFP